MAKAMTKILQIEDNLMNSPVCTVKIKISFITLGVVELSRLFLQLFVE